MFFPWTFCHTLDTEKRTKRFLQVSYFMFYHKWLVFQVFATDQLTNAMDRFHCEDSFMPGGGAYRRSRSWLSIVVVFYFSNHVRYNSFLKFCNLSRKMGPGFDTVFMFETGEYSLFYNFSQKFILVSTILRSTN